MVTYCLGDPDRKKKTLKAFKGGVYLDNEEVIATFKKGKKQFFVLGKMPFSDFTVWEYLSYSSSLHTRRALKLSEVQTMMLRAGLTVKPQKRIARLDAVTQKIVRLAAKMKPDEERLYLNFDGLKYTASRRRKLDRYLKVLSCYEIMLSVSDSRFVPAHAATSWHYSRDQDPHKVKVIKRGSRMVKI